MMKNQWENLEKKGLNEQEIEYIKNTMIYFRDFTPGSDILKVFGWRNDLEMKVLRKEATPEEVIQYERVREIEQFNDILCNNIPKDVLGLARRVEVSDQIDIDFMVKLMMDNQVQEIQEAFDKKQLEEIFKEKFEQNPDEPFIRDLINKILGEGKKFTAIDSKIASAEFKHIDDKTIMSIAYLMLKEIQNAKQNNQRLKIGARDMDKDILLYLVIKNLSKNPLELNNDIKNIYAKNCPADEIREYIEKLMDEQEKYLKEGKKIPDELLIPQEVILSPKNIEFLMDSKFADYIDVGAGETGDELQFYWKENDKLPALEIRAQRREDGKYILTYIREGAGLGRKEFIWDKNTEEGKRGVLVVSTKEDALEEICDMDDEVR